MTDTMDAVVCYGPRDYRLEKLPVPEVVGEDEILVKVESVGETRLSSHHEPRANESYSRNLC
jgi:threonine dehydrogenase-like Zn-dependent dehydrogenase